jgi:HAD superfamily hydrolase (TIGR01549 family)
MARLQMGDLPFDADLVVFDKDGTLIEFEAMWGRLAMAWVERLTAGGEDESLERDLYNLLGYDVQQRRTRPQSPLSIATTRQLRTLVSGVLYGRGVPWTDAEDRTRQAFAVEAELPLADLIQPAGDVAGLLAGLQARGVRVGVITTDHRAETEETLQIMGITQLIDHVVCGDDGLPWKPEPDTLLATCQQLAVPPARTAVVGDTAADLIMARRAGAGLGVAVLTGNGQRDQLAAYADVVLDSIDEIRL